MILSWYHILKSQNHINTVCTTRYTSINTVIPWSSVFYPRLTPGAARAPRSIARPWLPLQSERPPYRSPRWGPVWGHCTPTRSPASCDPTDWTRPAAARRLTTTTVNIITWPATCMSRGRINVIIINNNKYIQNNKNTYAIHTKYTLLIHLNIYLQCN